MKRVIYATLIMIQILHRAPKLGAIRTGRFLARLPARQAVILPFLILHALVQRNIRPADRAIFALRLRQRHPHDRPALLAAPQLPPRRIRQMGYMLAPWAGS